MEIPDITTKDDLVSFLKTIGDKFDSYDSILSKDDSEEIDEKVEDDVVDDVKDKEIDEITKLLKL